MSDIVRVLRVIEYRGPRAEVESQVEKSLHGTKCLPNGVIISAATVGNYPEILDNPVPEETTFPTENTGNTFNPRQESILGRPTKEEVLAMVVVDLNLTTRAHNCLESAKIFAVADLVKHTPYQLLFIRHLGKQTLREIERELARYNLKLSKYI